ncbi:MAG: MFS transporter [Candidatus Rokuibacteriota bacterium]
MFFGWKVVAVAFVVALFGWGLSFYGLGIYLVVLHQQHGWPISLISFAITTYYVLAAGLIVVVGDAFDRYGPRTVVLASMGALALSVLLLPLLSEPWQLYAAFALMAVGWAGMGGAAITAIVAPWFETKRGLAVSLALNGASAGGLVLVPLWTALIATVGFGAAAVAIVGGMVVLLVPLAILWLPRGPHVLGVGPDGAALQARARGQAHAVQHAQAKRGRLLVSPHFWTIALPFALGLFAQVGFLTHQIAYLTPSVGAARAALAVSLTTLAAIVGRVGTGLVVDRVDRRLAAAANFFLQAAAVVAMIVWPSPAVLYAACVAFGLAVGNMITFPALIVQAEYPGEHFARVVSLVLAINQITFAFGPGVVGWARDRTDSYTAGLLLCAACEVVGGVVVMIRAERETRRAG